jgi:hypothetical protein
VLLVGGGGENILLPKLRAKETVGSLQGVEHSLDEVTHGTGVSTGTGVAIGNSGHVHKLLSSWGRNKPSTTWGGDKTHSDGSAFSSYLAGNSVGKSSLTSPVSTTNGCNVELGGNDGSTNSSGDLRCTLNSKSNMTIVVSKSNESLETSALTSRRLLLYRHDLHNLILKFVLEEEVNNLGLLYRKREEENFLEGSNLSVFNKTSKLGYWSPTRLFA